MASQILPSNTFTTAKWIVSATASDGTHTTIASALTSASSGDTIFIRQGTYTENLTLKAGVNLAAYDCDALTPNVTIAGTCTFTAAGTVSISGIRLQTNSAAAIAVTGSAASILQIKNCYLNFTNNTGITFSAANTSAAIYITDCRGDLGTTGIGLFAHSSTGAMQIVNTFFTNSGASTTASTCSAGVFDTSNSQFLNPITMSSTSGSTWEYSAFISTTNTTVATLGGSTHSCKWCRFQSGSASAISIGGAATFFQFCDVESTNTNAITGAGTINYTPFAFPSTSKLINTTTQTIVSGAHIVRQVFTSTGTYTPTPGMYTCDIEVVGSGGGGGGCAATNGTQYASAGGGGGGGYARKTVFASTIGASQAVTIGAAGTAGSTAGGTGGTGGTCSLGAIVSATGGIGGTGGTPGASGQSAGGAGGAGSGGDFNCTGSPGTWGICTFGGAIMGSTGGSSFFGGGAQGSAANATGTTAFAYGGGGSGSNIINSASGTAGGAGFKGIVVVTEYIIN